MVQRTLQWVLVAIALLLVFQVNRLEDSMNEQREEAAARGNVLRASYEWIPAPGAGALVATVETRDPTIGVLSKLLREKVREMQSDFDSNGAPGAGK